VGGEAWVVGDLWKGLRLRFFGVACDLSWRPSVLWQLSWVLMGARCALHAYIDQVVPNSIIDTLYKPSPRLEAGFQGQQ
jgi:hypothetical protein